MNREKELKLNIFIAVHKPSFYLNDEIYKPVQVGTDLVDFSLDILKDNKGDNISQKNKTFAELTMLYWVWKNKMDADYIGICHYRRYFYPLFSFKFFFIRFLNENFKKIINFFTKSSAREVQNLKRKEIMQNSIKTKIKKFLQIEGIDKNNFLKKKSKIDNNLLALIKKYDIIMPLRITTYKNNIKHTWENTSFKGNTWEVTKRIIKSKMAKKYFLSFCKIEKSYRMSGANMVIMKKEIFNEYCNWLFNLLFYLESDSEHHYKRKKNEERIFGMLSETLLNVFIENKKDILKIKEIPVCTIKNEYKKRL